jgi:hypothetical protein
MVLRRHLSQSENVEIVTDVSGNGSLAVTLKNPYPHTDYAVVVTPQQADNDGEYEVVSKTKTGFSIAVTGSEHKSQEVINTTGNTVTFADADPDTITRASGDWTTLFSVGDKITVLNSTSNDGVYTIATVTALVITLVAADSLAAETQTTETALTFTTDNGVDVSYIAKRNDV